MFKRCQGGMEALALSAVSMVLGDHGRLVPCAAGKIHFLFRLGLIGKKISLTTCHAFHTPAPEWNQTKSAYELIEQPKFRKNLLFMPQSYFRLFN